MQSREVVNNLPDNHVVVKHDFVNALNSVWRDTIFRRNETHCSSPYAIVVCVCGSVCLSVCVCRVCGPQENGLR